MQLITKKTILAVLVVGLVLTLCGNTEVNGSSGVAWVSWDSWIKNATSGSIPYKCGTIEVEILPTSVPSQNGGSTNGFKNTSPKYSNIDSITYNYLGINSPGQGEINDAWSVVFDFVNTALTSSGVFNVGQMFYSSRNGPITELEIRMYGEDDQTLYSLHDLNFDEFALNYPDFDGPIKWDPETGLLRPLPVTESQNSRFAFFNPNSGKIGKIEVDAKVAGGGQDSINFGFGILSDCSEDGWVTINGTVTFNGNPVNAMVLANGQYMFSSGEQEGLNIGEYELFVPLNPNDCSITLFAFVDGLAPFKCILTPEEAMDFNIEMELASPDSKTPTVTSTAVASIDNPGWIDIAGSVSLEGTPLCAMVLANGQYMFSCDPIGEYQLSVPLDPNGEITLFVFVDGLQPYKEIFSP